MLARICASAIGALLLSACQSPIETQPVSQTLAPAPPPAFAVGDAYTWAKDGREYTDSVVAIDGDVVSWQSTDGSTWRRVADFAVPAAEWDTAEFGQGAQSASEIEGGLFPLEVGKTMAMRVQGQSTKYPDGWDQTRSCVIESQERVTVPAGEYDTYKVVCREGNRTYTWYHAPEVGFPVIYWNYHRSQGGKPQYLVSFAHAGTS